MPPVSGPAMCVGNGNDDDSGRLDSIDHAVRKPTQQEPACPVVVRRPGGRRPLDFGRGYIEFVSKPGGGPVGLRSAYQRAASSASASASSRYSSVRVTAGSGENAATSLRPGHGLR